MTSRWGLAGLVTVVAAVGPLVGVVWWALAPVVPGVFVYGQVFPRETEPGGYAAADAYFAIITFVVGVIAAIVVRRWWRGSPSVAVLGLALGGLAGSAIAVLVAYAFAGPRLPDVPPGTAVDAALTLGASGWLLVWPIASVGLWFFVDLFTLRSGVPEPASV